MTDPNSTLTNEEHRKLEKKAEKLAIIKRKTRIPDCPCCGTRMMFRHGNIHKNPMAWGQNWKCPECYLIEGFGIPLTKEEFEEVKELQNGHKHYNGKPKEDVEEKEIKENLKELGYLGME